MTASNTPLSTRSLTQVLLSFILTTSNCLLHDRQLAGLARAPPGENRSFSRPEATSHTCTSPSSRDIARWLPSGENRHSSLASSVLDIATQDPRGLCACVEIACSSSSAPFRMISTYQAIRGNSSYNFYSLRSNPSPSSQLFNCHLTCCLLLLGYLHHLK